MDENPYSPPQTDPKQARRKARFSLLFIPAMFFAIVSAIFGTCAAFQSQSNDSIQRALVVVTAIIALVLAAIAWAFFHYAFKQSRRH
jgi:hypothetical protein